MAEPRGTERPSVPQRPVPGPIQRLSAITLSLDKSGPRIGVGAELIVPLLRRARQLGVTSFDLGAAPGAEELFVRAFPDPDPELVVIVRALRPEAPDGDGPRRRAVVPRGEAAPTSRTAPWVGTVDRLRGRYRVLVEWGESSPGGPTPSDVHAAIDLGQVVDEVRAIRSSDSAGSARGLFSGPFSLLAPRFAADWADPDAGGRALVARNVFADGALDGSFLEGPGLAGRSVAAPPTLADLHGRLDPIVGLAFLTRDRRRTLIEAALGFVLQWRWVATAVVPVPPPERLGPIVAASRAPPLDPDEVRRVLSAVVGPG